MSYAEDYALAFANLDFRGRVSMCVAEQAKSFVNDGRAEFYVLAQAAIDDNIAVTAQFLPLVATQPDMTSESTDADLLAAVQALWAVVGATYIPPAASIVTGDEETP
jgi:hypothetical protein